jgi:hypothetical protein
MQDSLSAREVRETVGRAMAEVARTRRVVKNCMLAVLVVMCKSCEEKSVAGVVAKVEKGEEVGYLCVRERDWAEWGCC